MIVLTATTAERVHGQERTGIIQSRMMIARIADRHIRTSQITKRPVIRHQRSWITVERNIFEVISPIRIATDQKHDLVGSHLLHKTTSLRTLSRIEETDTGILIRPKHSTRNLAESTAYQTLDIIAGSQHRRIFCKQKISGRFAKTLGDIHIVPVRKLSRFCPIRRIPVNLFGQPKK